MTLITLLFCLTIIISKIMLNDIFLKTNIKKKKINIIPLIDIIFLMLIFFMLATNFNQNEEIDFSIIKNSNEKNIDKKTLKIILKDSGNIIVNSKLINNQYVKKNIEKIWENNSYKEIIILNEENVKTQTLIDLMDDLKQIGIKNIFFSDLND